MTKRFNGLQQRGVTTTHYDDINDSLTPESTSERICALLGMGRIGIPDDDPDAGGSVGAIVEFPGSFVSVIYNPKMDEFDLELTDKDLKPFTPEGIFQFDAGSIAILEYDEMSVVLRQISKLAINRNKGDTTPGL